ncbi:MAG: hypothetical protein LBT40_05125 [Deltaproteobacteria bacterium]|nr:hypothetical protein [Deltaproteobacteria bacterium]
MTSTYTCPPYPLEDRKGALRGEPALELLYGEESASVYSTDGFLHTIDKDGVDRALAGRFPFRGGGAGRFSGWIMEECARQTDSPLPMAAFDPRAPFAESHAG